MKFIMASRAHRAPLVHIEASEGTMTLCGCGAGPVVHGTVGPTCGECRLWFLRGFRSYRTIVGEIDQASGEILITPDVGAWLP